MEPGIDDGTAMPKKVIWAGSTPTRCDNCHALLILTFYDAPMTRGGPWGCLCPTCFRHGSPGKLGTGLGQEYTKQANGDWLCTGGLE